MPSCEIGFIGAGNMAQALIGGILKSAEYQPENIWASAPSDRNLCKLKDLGCNTTNYNDEVVQKTKVVFLCVKPYQFDNVLSELMNSRKINGNHILVSIAGGIDLKTLQYYTNDVPVIRAMPNTPVAVGKGIIGFTRGRHATEENLACVTELFKPCALCEELPESVMDTFSALCGSGPAYVYTIIQALADGAVKMGIPRHLATRLSAQTVLGGAQMVLNSGKHPIELRDEVCSPGGSTIEGIQVMERSGLPGTLMETVQAATLKSKEMGLKAAK